LHQAQAFNEYVPCSTPHADLIRAINTLHQRSPLDISFIYVPGHQDAFSQFEDLSPLARLNVWADRLAKQELYRVASLPDPPCPPNSLTGETWSAFIADTKIVADPCPPILDALGRKQALQYWETKGHLNNESFQLVQWDHLEKAIKSFLHTFQMWLSKFISGHSAVGVTMFWWKQWDSALCPVCQSHKEMVLHVLLCPHQTHQSLWTQ